MYRVNKYERPETVEACAELLRSSPRSMLIAGNMFLRMSNINIPLAIDLSACGLDYVRKEEDGTIRIGAMCTLRELEVNPLLRGYCAGLISQAAGEIIGVQFRNLATAGASVFSKYGFSDVITPLLAVDARINLFEQGEISLEEFLKQPLRRDLLTEIILPSCEGTGKFMSFRNSAGDFSILNVAVSSVGGRVRIAVGARPARAALAYEAMKLADAGARQEEVAAAAAAELSFGTNMRGSAEYRRALCSVLVERALTAIGEVE